MTLPQMCARPALHTLWKAPPVLDESGVMDDALIAAIVAADTDGVVAALRGRSEADRAAFAKVLVPAQVAADGYGVFARGPDGGLRWNSRTGPAGDRALQHEYDQSPVVNLAIIGTATPQQMRRVAWSLSWFDDDAGAAVLLDRNPPWLATWVQWLLTTQTMMVRWPFARSLVRAGAIERPPAYTRALLTRGWDRGELARALAADPEFWERDVWELLAHRDDEGSLRAADHHGWSALILAADIDRDRLLDAVLAGLVDESAYRAAWFVRMWKALKVTADERAARVDVLRTLLGGESVGFAVEELSRPGGSVAPADLSPALAAPAKKTVRAALKLLDREPALAAIALGHPDAGVQGEVLDRLERWELDDAARGVLLQHLDLLAATVRPRAEALLGLTPPVNEDVVVPDVSPVPEAIRAALNFGGPLPPAPIAGEPVLDEPVEPIASIDELVAELRSRFDDHDRVLDGLLRFCDRPAPRELADGWYGFEAQAWVERRVAPVMEDSTRRAPSAAEQQIARGVTGRYLPLRTHAGGWIDPRALVERLREPASAEELATALLRLAPDHRDEALEAARDVPGRPGELLRCALGGEPVDGDDAFAARAVRLPPLEHIEAGVRLELEPWGGYRCTATVSPDVARPFPLRRDITAAKAFEKLWWNLGDYSNEYTGVSEFLQPLVAPREPIAPLTLRLVVAALGSGHEREHLLALDVLIAAIEDGRIDTLPPTDVPHLKPNRLAARLGALAATGPLHAAIVRDLLDASAHRFPARSGPLLVLFDELCAQTGAGPDASREHLRTLKHRAAKALLKREHAPPETEAQLALAARVRRAERWSTR
jgi:hypothetical protein